MTREVLRELVSALTRMRRGSIDARQVDLWAQRLEPHLAEIELLAAVALDDRVEPAFLATPVDLSPSCGPPDRAAHPAPAARARAGGALAPPAGAGSTGAAARATSGRGASGGGVLSLAACIRLLRSGATTASELVDASLSRLAKLGGLNLFIAVFEAEARRAAEQADRALRAGQAGLLAGVPLAVKDLMAIQGYALTGGSRALTGPPAQEDAPALRRLREAGAVVLGAANLHELAYGVTSENPHFGVVGNPAAPGRIAGGSSGGSAAAVAAGVVAGAVGTDTGGSIRIPAALCGVAGLKPTYGAVSREGVLPLSWSLDHVGPIAVTAADTALLFAAMASQPSLRLQAFARALAAPDPGCGEDEGELPEELRAACLLARSLDEGGPVEAAAISRAAGRMRVGCPVPDWLEPMEEPVARAYRDVQQRLREAGLAVVEVQPPPMAWVRAAQFVILQTEATAVHRERLRGFADRLGEDVRLRLRLGEFLTAVEYVQGQRLRRQIADSLRELFHTVDVLLLPSVPACAPPVGSRTVEVNGHVEPIHRMLTRYTVPFNQGGLPALSVPVGRSGAGWPSALQVVGPPSGELEAVRLGIVLQALCGPTWPDRVQ